MRLLPLCIAPLCAAPLQAQRSVPARLVVAAVDSLVRQAGTVHDMWVPGNYDGPKAPFHMVGAAFDTARGPGRDSILMALVSCFSDTTPTGVRYATQPVVRGALCYLLLESLVYRETDPGENWPGNFYDFPSPARLRAAQRAWRQAVRQHWYVAS